MSFERASRKREARKIMSRPRRKGLVETRSDRQRRLLLPIFPLRHGDPSIPSHRQLQQALSPSSSLEETTLFSLGGQDRRRKWKEGGRRRGRKETSSTSTTSSLPSRATNQAQRHLEGYTSQRGSLCVWESGGCASVDGGEEGLRLVS